MAHLLLCSVNIIHAHSQDEHEAEHEAQPQKPVRKQDTAHNTESRTGRKDARRAWVRAWRLESPTSTRVQQLPGPATPLAATTHLLLRRCAIMPRTWVASNSEASLR